MYQEMIVGILFGLLIVACVFVIYEYVKTGKMPWSD